MSMLGDLIYEAKGMIVYQRILAVEPRIKVENTILLNGLIHGNVNITDIGTFINTIIDITMTEEKWQNGLLKEYRNSRSKKTAKACSAAQHFTIQRQKESLLFLIIV